MLVEGLMCPNINDECAAYTVYIVDAQGKELEDGAQLPPTITLRCITCGWERTFELELHNPVWEF